MEPEKYWRLIIVFYLWPSIYIFFMKNIQRTINLATYYLIEYSKTLIQWTSETTDTVHHSRGSNGLLALVCTWDNSRCLSQTRLITSLIVHIFWFHKGKGKREIGWEVETDQVTNGNYYLFFFFFFTKQIFFIIEYWFTNDETQFI